MKTWRIFFGIVAASGFLAACSNGGSSPVANNGTNDETYSLRAYLPDGKPAEGAQVRVVGVKDTTAVAVGTVDANGDVATPTLRDGIYAFNITQDSLVSHIEAVEVKNGKLLLDNRKDTLRLMGSVSGVVAVEPQDDPSTVVVHVLGTEIWANVRRDGTFRLDRIGAGEYLLALETNLPHYTRTFANATATNGRNTTLPDTIWITYNWLPSIRGVAVRNDSATGDQILSWQPARNVVGFMDYAIFRDSLGTILPSKVPVAVTNDTTWRDPDASEPTRIRKWRYIVVARDHNATPGPWKDAVVGTSIPAWLRGIDDISWNWVANTSKPTGLGTVGGKLAVSQYTSGASRGTLSVKSSTDGILWDSIGISIPATIMGQAIQWTSGIGAGQGWAFGHSDLGDGIYVYRMDANGWHREQLDDTLWLGGQPVCTGSDSVVALVSSRSNSSNSSWILWRRGGGEWKTTSISGQFLGASDRGILTDGGGRHVLLVSWDNPSHVLEDFGSPPEPSAGLMEPFVVSGYRDSPSATLLGDTLAYRGRSGLWLRLTSGWVFRSSPTIELLASSTNLLVVDPYGRIHLGSNP